MNPREERILRDRLVPCPETFKIGSGNPYRIADGCALEIACEETSGDLMGEVKRLFKSYWQAKPASVAVPSTGKAQHAEGFHVRVDASTLRLEARTRRGVQHALRTLRQLAETERGVERHASHLLSPCEVSDGPALGFRGVHLCAFPESEFFEIEKAVRLAAQYKFNHVVLECWGNFPFKSHPWFGWAERRIPREKLSHLVKISRELGITIIPQLNLLGHASGSRAMGGKHAILDLDPTRQSLFEPDGWSWCLTNPNTRRILSDLVAELHDFIGKPPYFHIGFDEADNLATCHTCRAHHPKELVKEHLMFFRDFLAKRGAQTILWHDMLVENIDPRWKGYTACGLPDQELSRLHEELPKDLILADWQYDFPAAAGSEPHWPTARFFKAQGFPVLVCPWDHEGGIRSQGKLAVAEGLMGMLATTWHHHHDEDYCRIFHTAAKAAWEKTPDWGTSHLSRRLVFAKHLRMVGWDMKVTQYRETGACQYQLPPSTWPTR